MKELHLKAYDTLRMIEVLSKDKTELNRSMIEDYQRQYDALLLMIFNLSQNPIFMRFTLNPEAIKSVIWEVKDKQYDFNTTFQNIFKTLHNG